MAKYTALGQLIQAARLCWRKPPGRDYYMRISPGPEQNQFLIELHPDRILLPSDRRGPRLRVHYAWWDGGGWEPNERAQRVVEALPVLSTLEPVREYTWFLVDDDGNMIPGSFGKGPDGPPFTRPRAAEPGRYRYWLADGRSVSRQRLHQLRCPEKHRARAILHDAIKRGQILRATVCSECGAEVRTPIGHLDDYTKPLAVRWLCRACDKAAHRLAATGG